MYIESDRDDLRAICLPEMEDSADFSENGIAQVTADDGEVLLSEYPEEFSEHNADSNTTDD